MATGIAIAGLALSAYSAYQSGQAIEDAGAAQAAATLAGIESQERMFEKTRADTAPWRETGTRALFELERMVEEGPGEYEESPGYQFRLDEGIKAHERGAAARGGQLSGAQLKSLERFGQDYATADYDNFLNRYYNRLTPYQSLANVGQTSTNTLANIGANTAGNISNLHMAGGQAKASSYINQANIQNQFLQNAMNTGAWWYGQTYGNQN